MNDNDKKKLLEDFETELKIDPIKALESLHDNGPWYFVSCKICGKSYKQNWLSHEVAPEGVICSDCFEETFYQYMLHRFPAFNKIQKEQIWNLTKEMKGVQN